MKRLLIYILALIAITGPIFMVMNKNFPSDIAEISLNSVVHPEQISKTVEDLLLFDYLNIYDIYSYEGNAKLYSGNINILLKKKGIEHVGITLGDDEVIVGDRYMKEHFNYNLLGERYTSNFGEYAVNGIIKNNDSIYYTNSDILQNTDVKKQTLYVSLINTKKRMADYSTTVNALSYYDINVSKSIYYADVNNFFKKLLILFILSALSIVFLKILSYTKKNTSQIMELQKSSSYDLELWEFILKPDNFKIILKTLAEIVLEIIIIFAVLRLTTVFLNTRISYSVDFTSLKSMTDAIKAFLNLIKYYINNGFTDISLAIVKCLIIYLVAAALIIAINSRKLFGKLKKLF